MIKFICIEILTIALVSLICFYVNIKDKKIEKCKLEKFSLLIYSLVLGLLWIILLNTSIYFFKYTKLKFIVFGVLGLILLFILNEILKRIKLKYLYRNKEYNTTERYKQFINKNINNTEKIQKYIEEITETFVNNLKENRNELIFIKENNNNEDYLYHNCIDTANNIKRNILLADVNKIGDTILIMLPDLIYYCSHILKLINSIWDEDDVYTERINSILEELKF